MTQNEPAAAARRRRTGWWIAGGLVCILVLAPQLFLSFWGASFASRALSRALEKPVTVHALSGGWWSPLKVLGLTISDSFEGNSKDLLTLGRVDLGGPVWLLVLPGASLHVSIEDARVELRRLPDGRWNIASLQPAPDTGLPDNVLLPDGALTFQLERAQVYVEPEDRVYSLTARAESLSFRERTLKWHAKLWSKDGESLTAGGSFENLARPQELAGSAKVELAGLDLAVVPALLPWLPAMYPDGTVEAGDLEITLAGLARFQARAAFDLRDISLPDPGAKTDGPLAHAAVRIAVVRDRGRWAVEALSLESPHGRIALEPGAWFEMSGDTWQGQLQLRAELEDAGPASRALTMLLPDPLSLAGPLSFDARVEGRVRLDSEMRLGERLAHAKASLDLKLAQAGWREARLENMVAAVNLDGDRLTVSKLAAAFGGGHVEVRGQLPLGDHSGGGLSWSVRDLPLGAAFGPPLRTLDVKDSTGRVTFDGETYHFESETSVRELDFDPVAIAGRVLRINDANLTCAGALAGDFKRIDITTCHLKAVQGDLSSRSGGIDLGSEPGLTIDLEGWLSGPFLTALVPEFNAGWPGRIDVAGDLTMPFTGRPWLDMQWQVDVSGRPFTHGGVVLDHFQGRVTKSVGRLDLDISGERGAGSLRVAGSLKLDDKDPMTLALKAERFPFRRELVNSYTLEGEVSGSANVAVDAEAERASVDNRLAAVKVLRARKVVASLENASLKGDLTHTRGGGLWTKDLVLAGRQLELRIHDSHLPVEGRGRDAAKLNVDFAGAGSWLTLAAALGGLHAAVADGESRLSLRLQATPGRVLESLQGRGELSANRLSLWGHSLSSAETVFELHPREVKLTRGFARYGSGQVGLEGNIILPLERGNRKEHLVLRLEKVPVTHTRTFAPTAAKGPATLTTETIIDGRVALDGTADGQLVVSAELDTGPVTRRFSPAQEDLPAVQLSPMHFESKLFSQSPLQHWTVAALTLRGQGVSIRLTDGQLLRQAAAHNVAGNLAIEMSPEFIQAASPGLLPRDIGPTETVTASGRAMLRVPDGGGIGPGDIEFDGTVQSEKLLIHADELRSLRLRVRLTGGRLQVDQGEASLLGGRIWLPAPSSIDLGGAAHAFSVHVAARDLKLTTYGGRQVSLGRFLGLLVPVFLFNSRSEKAVSVTGVLQTELQLTGAYENAPNWSRSVNGNGSFRIDQGAVVGSTVVSGIITRSLLMPTNVIHNSIAALFSRDGQVGRALTGLADRAFTFRTIESPITVREGEIFLKKDLVVSSPEMTLTINGHSNLEGQLDYDITTDLIKRVRLGEITDLPNRIPIIGRAISFINPFTYLDGIELRARVTGNFLKTAPDGRPDVHVATSVTDTKEK